MFNLKSLVLSKKTFIPQQKGEHIGSPLQTPYKAFFLCLSILFLSSLFVSTVDALDFENAICAIEPNGKGKEYSIEFLSLSHKISTKTQTDSETDDFIELWSNSVDNLDFRRIYNSKYLGKLQNGYRSASFYGINGDRYYTMGLISPKTNQSLDRFGNFIADFGFKENRDAVTHNSSFSGYLDANLALKHFSHQNYLRWSEGLLSVIDPTNIESLNNDQYQSFPNITGESRLVLNAFYESFPNFLSQVEKYMTLSSLLDIKTYQGVKYTEFNMKCSIYYPLLTKEFPKIAAYFINLKELFQIGVNVKNIHGHSVVKLMFDSRNEFISAFFCTKNGEIIPFDKDGLPVFKEAYRLTSLKDYLFSVETDMYFNVYGLKIITDNIVANGMYSSSDTKGSLHFDLAKVESCNVYGNAYHVMPSWLIDLMIPSNINQLIADFFQLMVDANGQKGSHVDFDWDTLKKDDVVLNYKVSTEFLENFFISFGFKVWRDKFRIPPDALSEFREFDVIMTESVIKDMESFKCK